MRNHPIIVQKYGGVCLETPAKIRAVARSLADLRARGAALVWTEGDPHVLPPNLAAAAPGADQPTLVKVPVAGIHQEQPPPASPVPREYTC